MDDAGGAFVAVVFDVAGEVAGGAAGVGWGGVAVFAGEDAAAQWCPGEQAEAVVFGGGCYFAFDAAFEQGVFDLGGD